jgi:hypothetical protein
MGEFLRLCGGLTMRTAHDTGYGSRGGETAKSEIGNSANPLLSFLSFRVNNICFYTLTTRPTRILNFGLQPTADDSQAPFLKGRLTSFFNRPIL